jgi:hypothetical protein
MRRSVVVVAVVLSLPSIGLLAGCGSHPAGRQTVVSVVGVRSQALRILSPHNRAQLTLPAAVRYQFDGLPAGATLRVYYEATPVDEYRSYPLASADGTITLPDDKVLCGVRTLTFCLVDCDQLLAATCQTLHDLVLTGRK